MQRDRGQKKKEKENEKRTAKKSGEEEREEKRQENLHTASRDKTRLSRTFLVIVHPHTGPMEYLHPGTALQPHHFIKENRAYT